MIDGGWHRARKPEQRAERERQILEAAEKLFAEFPYEDVTMQRVARETGISQSNLYRYFATREEVFLRLFRDDLGRWLDDVLGSIGPAMSIAAFVEAWTAALLRQERLLELHPRLALSLERNASERVFRETKRGFLVLLERGIPAMRAALPFPDDGAVLRFLEIHLGLVSGLAPMARYSPMQERVLAEPGLSALRIDFGDVYRRGIETYLRGALETRES